MAGGPSQQAAEHIAPALIGGHYTVADHKGSAADMVCDHPEGNIGFGVRSIFHPSDFRNVLHDILHRIDQEQVIHTLHNAGQAFQPHTGIDVFMLQGRIVSLAVVIKLGENQVPKFHVPVAVASHPAGRRTASIFLTPVKIKLGARAAGAGAMLPEIIFFSQPDDTAGIHPDLLGPNVESLVVILVNGNPNPLNRQLQHLGAELPSPSGSLMLKIISKREIPQHFKISTMAGGNAYPLNIRGADAFLTRGNPVSRRSHLPGKILLHRRHTGVNQQQALVSIWHQGKAGQPKMAL